MMNKSEETFTNELGNEIQILVEGKEVDGVPGIAITLHGPTSTSEQFITRMEAEKLQTHLGKILYS